MSLNPLEKSRPKRLGRRGLRVWRDDDVKICACTFGTWANVVNRPHIESLRTLAQKSPFVHSIFIQAGTACFFLKCQFLNPN